MKKIRIRFALLFCLLLSLTGCGVTKAQEEAFRQGEEALQAGKPEEAEEAFKSAETKGRGAKAALHNAQVARDLGILYYEQEDWAKAVEEFHRALAINETEEFAGDISGYLGDCYAALEQNQEAVEAYTKALACIPDTPLEEEEEELHRQETREQLEFRLHQCQQDIFLEEMEALVAEGKTKEALERIQEEIFATEEGESRKLRRAYIALLEQEMMFQEAYDQIETYRILFGEEEDLEKEWDFLSTRLQEE